MDTPYRPSDVLAARILVVDDHEDHARMIETTLSGAGFTGVSVTLDPREVAVLYRKNRFDLIILDLKMPGMDGFQVMAALKEEEAVDFIPILVVTGEPDHLPRALNEGAKDFITKPVKIEELLARVRNLMELHLLLKEKTRQEAALARILQDRTAKLMASESRFRALVEQSIAGIYMVEDERISYANPRMCALLGYSLEELRRFDSIDLVLEEDRERMRQRRVQREAGDVGALTATFRFRHKDGGVVHLTTDVKVLEQDGRRVRLGVAQDVTEQVRARELLLESDRHYRALVEQSIVGIYIIADRRVIYANPKLCAITGFSLGECSAMTLYELVVEEDHGVLADVFRRREAGETGSIVLHCRIRRKDGGIAHLRIDSKLIELGEKVVAVGVVEDDTERALAEAALRESEEKYRLLWETASDVVILMGEDMRIQDANPSIEGMFGYAPEEVVGRNIALLQPERLREPHRRGAKRYLETGVRTLNWRAAEAVGLHRDGHEFPVEIAFSHLEIGGVSVFAAFMRDITERKRAQAALESANRHLQFLSHRVLAVQEEERREISSELHDDVGQSLAALMIGLHRIEAHVDPGQQGLLAECVHVCGTVQEKLREISLALRPRQLDQLGLRDALRWLVSRHQGLTGLAVKHRFGGAEDALIPAAVATACYRICQEALMNATRHARAKTIHVEVETREGSLELAIRDDGIGFDSLAMHANAPTAGGGLGLTSMEERARLAGGRLELRTEPGAGTCVVAAFSFDAGGSE